MEERTRRTTWIDPEGQAWRIERIVGRWQLSRYLPASETWLRIGSYPSRTDAVQAAYREEGEPMPDG